MALSQVTGRTKLELQEMRAEYEGTDAEFEERYCLSKIPRQPPDYDGLPRFCVSKNVQECGSSMRCPNHGGATPDDVIEDTSNLDPLGNMKHGMYATRENLLEDFDVKDRALYEWVVEHYAETYGIDARDDPQAAYDLHRLATEIVRAERGRGHVITEGEVQEDPVRNEEGRVVVDDNGEIVTEKSGHYLHKMLHDQDNKITSLEKELGISRKEQAKRENEQDAVEALENFTDLGAAFLERSERDYDPDEQPWEESSDDGD